MKNSSPPTTADLWSDWLLRDRFADDAGYERTLRAQVAAQADRVLDSARLAAGMTVVDVGCGDGLVAFRAIDRIGPSLRVYMADVSPTLLQRAATLATERNVRDQCTFLECSAEALQGIDDACVDVIMTRAVIAYLPDKPAIFREFRRILKPGGRISLAEPIRRDEAFEASSLRTFVEGLPAGSDAHFFRLLHRWKAAQFPDTEPAILQNPMTNYSERDLVRYALDSGFTDIHLEFHIDVAPATLTSWETLLKSAPFPWVPPLGKLLAEEFTREERELFEQAFRPSVGSGQLFTADRVAYLSAGKPRQ